MVILSLNLQHFGKFENRTVTLRPGMNIITGKNASGKTTISEFIPAMLYGLQTGSKRWQSFLPGRQKDAAYDGTMQILHEDVFYEIERNFKEGEESLVIYVLPDRTPLENPEEFLSRLLVGVTEENFLNHFMVSSEHLSKTRREWTEEGLTEEDLKRIRVRKHFKRAEEYLEKQEESLSAGLDDTVEDRKAVLEAEITEKSDLVSRLASGISANNGVLERETAEKARLQKEIEQAVHEKGIKEQQLEKISPLAEKTKKNRHKRPVLSIIFFTLSVLAIIGAFLTAYFKITTIYIYVIPQLSAFMIIGSLGLFLLGILFLIVALSKRRRALSLMAKEEELIKETEELTKIMEKSKRLSDVDLHITLVSSENDELNLELSEAKGVLSTKTEEHRIVSAEAKQMAELREEISAVQIARESFSNLSKVSIDPELLSLNEIANTFYEKMSNTGEYKLYLSEDRLLYLKRGDETVKLDLLSKRAAEEALFSMQLALLQKDDQGNVIPFVLDDAFAGYDAERMNAALSMLREMERQVVVLTCHQRERQAL